MKVVLLLHALMSVALIGAATHNGITSIRYFFGDVSRVRAHRRWVAVTFWTYLGAFVLGNIMYPLFRTGVRAAYLDATFPLATGFFEVKEHWIALGFALLLWYYPASRKFGASDPFPRGWMYPTAGIVIMSIVWMSALTGLALVAIKSL